MSAADSTEPAVTANSALVRAAARGELPEWAAAGAGRREHMARVADLLGHWASALGLGTAGREEWRAIGYLHDVLREAPAPQLREMVPPEFRDLPAPLLHGPAAAERLRGDLGAPALDAIRYHTIGHPDLALIGRALYLADFLEPGRDFEEEWRESLSARMPHEMDAVLREVVAARIRHLIEVGKPIRPETAGFWSVLVGGR